MTGTLLNSGAIILGSLLGLVGGRFLSSRFQETLNTILGVFTLGVGIHFFLQTKDFFTVLILMILGAFIGETLEIEDRLKRLFSRVGGGFTTASLMFCIGSMAILGPLEEGLTGQTDILALKSTFDGMTAIILTVSMGISVAFSALSVFIYQGGISVLAGQLAFLKEPATLPMINGVGGVCLFILGMNFLGIKQTRTANLIPAILLAFGWAWITSLRA